MASVRWEKDESASTIRIGANRLATVVNAGLDRAFPWALFVYDESGNAILHHDLYTSEDAAKSYVSREYMG